VKRADLEHLIVAAATIADDDELIIVGSQAVLAQFPDAPEEMLRSDEADIYPKNRPERCAFLPPAFFLRSVSSFSGSFITILVRHLGSAEEFNTPGRSVDSLGLSSAANKM